jgi:hypothetical protein
MPITPPEPPPPVLPLTLALPLGTFEPKGGPGLNVLTEPELLLVTPKVLVC